ncbi:hypothetical protein OG2516_07420 [Oceanicola granulosus HTCC2516]|uniref:Histidine kinase n=1 Tax=Oceanicola granulosus (strain ATCC BAA-861 / DSM 15982 / KCTC 12143 / HTCC2516) TaxID=314256 RepID=Q2CBF0_OCEGH|nr:DUF6446 family protein [Oceanicola granulosus]EAR50013.1 hypothetical protein OG2516_07420 [Oceanicola granulosus HTCC2516]
MTGRIAVIATLLAALLLGGGLYYSQVYAYYDEIPAEVANVQVLSAETGEPLALRFENFNGIDSTSSPIRYRACFELPVMPPEAARYEVPVPLTAPGWFDCFDAAAIGAALERGEAEAFLAAENVVYGVDRVIARFPDGRAFAWHQLNRCGEVVYDGDPAPEGCPPAPE